MTTGCGTGPDVHTFAGMKLKLAYADTKQNSCPSRNGT
jgi:hypothetical protein